MQLSYRSARQLNEVTLVTARSARPVRRHGRLLSAWGMNIVKADAFSNAAGVIVDTFQFTDTFRTLELNPPEIERFHASIRRCRLTASLRLRSCSMRAAAT